MISRQMSSQILEAATQYPAIDINYADLLQGLILFSVLVADFAANFKIVKKEEAKNA